MLDKSRHICILIYDYSVIFFRCVQVFFVNVNTTIMLIQLFFHDLTQSVRGNGFSENSCPPPPISFFQSAEIGKSILAISEKFSAYSSRLNHLLSSILVRIAHIFFRAFGGCQRHPPPIRSKIMPSQRLEKDNLSKQCYSPLQKYRGKGAIEHECH